MNTLLIFGYNTIIKISILEAISKYKQTTHLFRIEILVNHLQ